MTQADKIALVKAMLNNDATATTEVVTMYLNQAEAVLLNRIFPFATDEDVLTLPSKYDTHQCMLAQRYFLRQGAEGEVAHNENGVNRTYGSVNDEDILSQVIQKIKVH